MFALIAWVALIAWLLTVEPLWGRLSYRRLLAALDAGQVGARVRFYRLWIAQAWLLAAITGVVTWRNGWTLRQLGLVLPDRLDSLSGGVLGGFMGALIATSVIGIVRMRRARNSSPIVTPIALKQRSILRMLPRTRHERWIFAALAITAGITEELIWRGFGVASLHAVLPHLPVALTMLVLALAFGWAHLYQGVGGVIGTAIMGALLTGLYLLSGSLLLPMLLHALIDLRVLLLRLPIDNPAAIEPNALGADSAH